MTDEQWADPTMHAISVYLDGTDAPDDADDGTPLLDDDFLIVVNAYWEEVTFTIPPVRSAPQTWFVELDSYDAAVSAARVFPRHTGDTVVARPRSLQVLRAPRSELSRTSSCFAYPIGRFCVGRAGRYDRVVCVRPGRTAASGGTGGRPPGR